MHISVTLLLVLLSVLLGEVAWAQETLDGSTKGKIACIEYKGLSLMTKRACLQCNDMHWVPRAKALGDPALPARQGFWGCQPLPTVCPAWFMGIASLTYPYAVNDGHCAISCNWEKTLAQITVTSTKGSSNLISYGAGTPFKSALDALNQCARCCCSKDMNLKGPDTCGAHGVNYQEYEIAG